jgi:hypothetical protein
MEERGGDGKMRKSEKEIEEMSTKLINGRV